MNQIVSGSLHIDLQKSRQYDFTSKDTGSEKVSNITRTLGW